MTPLGYSLVIATFERPRELEEALSSILIQKRPPEETIIIDSSREQATREVVKSFESRIPLRYEQAAAPSAAMQRNQGARRVRTPLIGFLDDDVLLSPDTCAELCEVFDRDEKQEVGGVAARIEGMSHPRPLGLLWLYYRIQAGYPDRTYGGKLFGPAINCVPCYDESEGLLIRGDWLASTCVFYRRECFIREMFPDFHGYSSMEDVHLSGRIAKTHTLYFHAKALCEHRDASSPWKRDPGAMMRMRLRNQRLVSREIMGLSGPLLEWKMLLHRLFVSVYILRTRPPGWTDALIGAWT